MKNTVGVLLMAGALALGPVHAAERSGEQVVGAVCTACHGAGIMGAPKIGSKADWGPRIAKGKPTLYQHATAGFNAMPPKGTCTDCSAAELQKAVDYMVSKAK